MKYIKRCDDFGKEKTIHKDNASHFYIPSEKEKYNSKYNMYQAQENKHVKIIPSGLEKQEMRPKESQK